MNWEDGESPEGWKLTTLGAIADVVGGGTPKTSEPWNFSEQSGHPWVTPADLAGYTDKYIGRGKRFLTDQGLARSSAKYMPAGTVLFSSRAPIGYVAIAANPITTNQGFRSFVPSDELDSEYLYYALKFLLPLAEQYASGTTFAELSGSKAGRLPIAYPGREEQAAIARILDSADQSRRKTSSHLSAARRAIEQFRQATLAAACSGRLTADLREDDHQDGQDRPSSWTRTTVAGVCERVSVGHVGPTSKYYTSSGDGVVFVRSQNVRPGHLALKDVKFITHAFHDSLRKSQLQAGDVLIVRVGANRGDCCMVPLDYVGSLNCANIVFARPNQISSAFLSLYLQGPGRDLMLQETTGSAQGVINTKAVAATNILVPPLSEQHEIVHRVTRMFQLSEGLLGRVRMASRSVDQISQAVLAKAFRGGLFASGYDQLFLEGQPNG